ncbi:glycine betaine ABC transporter substrate-binding protein [Salisediminibacterium selenitireducens]|uniref:Substrate-binding region of ABC-type glycine betaine transport system n=1 Tax=Bacillus selenitireducens (strain ATCC 700615 / DSM 15326 / MLS10) TaxID=439292 RepID=D6XVU3_BACIE|nr:glycine betaine ABC transporter substrate-binding protein [Salisediminibacterium selenitireducens]ADH97716.1 Substrate-binding region of ABC-type glycine betaine transport system [[Bacillus] selenitireducens MLS10]
MRTWKKSLGAFSAVAVAASLTACGNNAEDNNDNINADGANDADAANNADGNEAIGNGEEITISQISWAENIAVTNMWKYVLEEKGYEIDLVLLDMGSSMAALDNGELDVNLEVWLPVQDANYVEQYGDTVNFSEATWFDNAKVGLVVPEYLEDVNSIEDLNEHADLFNGEIVGIEAGAGTMEVTEDLIEIYDLDLELVPSSEPAMLSEIGNRIEAGEAIVAPLWTPHWVFSEYDLKFLEDPELVYGDVEKIHHATRADFADDFPEIQEWFNNWKMTDEEIGELIDYVESADEPFDGAVEWVDENRDLIDEWVQ